MFAFWVYLKLRHQSLGLMTIKIKERRGEIVAIIPQKYHLWRILQKSSDGLPESTKSTDFFKSAFWYLIRNPTHATPDNTNKPSPAVINFLYQNLPTELRGLLPLKEPISHQEQ